MKFRAKPVVIEAFQYDGDLMNSSGEYYVPPWAVDAFNEGTLYFDEFDDVPAELFVKTPNGTIRVALDDYVVQWFDGALYPCEPEMFTQLFERTED